MPSIHNRSVLKSRRKILRTHGTPQEAILWNHLKNKKRGVKFRRQHSIGDFIVDFCCPEKRFIVELDGYRHGEKYVAAYDSERTSYLNELGYVVLRFWNNEINDNLDGVLLKIDSVLISPLIKGEGVGAEQNTTTPPTP